MDCFRPMKKKLFFPISCEFCFTNSVDNRMQEKLPHADFKYRKLMSN